MIRFLICAFAILFGANEADAGFRARRAAKAAGCSSASANTSACGSAATSSACDSVAMTAGCSTAGVQVIASTPSPTITVIPLPMPPR